MNGFISHIINRHLGTENNIMPRVPGRFESFNSFQQNAGEIKPLQSEEIETNSYQQTDRGNLKPLEKTGTNYGTNSSPFEALKVDKKDQEKSNFSMPDKAVDVFKEPSHFKENVSGKIEPPIIEENRIFNTTISNSTVASSDTKENSNNISPKPKETSISQIERNNSPNIVSPFVVQNAERSYTQKKGDHNENPVLPIQSSFVLQNIKDTSVHQHAIFPESAEQKAQPIIKVSIGRIEVRAAVSSAPEKKNSNTAEKPTMSLDDYLKKRNGDK
jgi:hypothetical protein